MKQYKEFTLRTVENILSIPAGRVATYGKIAALSGNSRGALSVVRVLSSLTEKFDLPWHRVVNGKGIISIKNLEWFNIQRELLLSEGVEVSEDGVVDLEIYGISIL